MNTGGRGAEAKSVAPPVSVVGAGWLGRAIAAAAQVSAAPRRSFTHERIEPGSTVFVASGRSAVGRHEPLAEVMDTELAHLREVLDACGAAGAARVIVLGSSDVAGLAEIVTGATPQEPLTPYAQVKAALENECRRHAELGLPVTSVRLAPVHGAGKARSEAMVRLARWPVLPLPAGGRHSIGFVLLADAVGALERLGRGPGPAVVSIGGGATPLRELLHQLALAQDSRLRALAVPLPGLVLRPLAKRPMPESLHWLIRLTLPRVVPMEVDAPVTPLPDAAASLVAAC